MNMYDNAMKLMTEKFGKDELWPVATRKGEDQDVRIVNGYYEDGAVYSVTYALSHKMKHIAETPNIAVCSFWFTGHGIGENLGWVRDEKNAEMMKKLRAAFAQWYDNGHTNEADPNTCLLRIRLTDGVLIDHECKYGINRYVIDFTKKAVQNPG